MLTHCFLIEMCPVQGVASSEADEPRGVTVQSVSSDISSARLAPYMVILYLLSIHTVILCDYNIIDRIPYAAL